jgi:protein TonB
MYENESEDPKPNSKPPYLFLIPVALGIFGFIGYQTVRMGTETSVATSPYVDTSLVQGQGQGVVENGVITVHASRPRAHHFPRANVKHVAMVKPHKVEASAAPQATDAPPAASASPSVAPEPTATAASTPEKTVAVKPHTKAHHAHKHASDDSIAVDPVPQIDRPIPARLASNASQSNDAATAPPITDAPMVEHHARAAQAAAPAATAKPVVVAQAPAAASGPINAADRIVDARMSYAAEPDYPDAARDQGLRGTSVVFVTVDAKGGIVRTTIASSSGNGLLDRAALSAARSSQYLAPKIDGKPAIETYRVTYDFAP